MENTDIKDLTAKIEKEHLFIRQIENEVGKIIVGQHEIIEKLIIGLISNGHILLEGVPGLAKTLTVKTLSDVIQTKFQRIQFTPDLLPADIIGTTIYNPQKNEFTIKKGPIFANLILADEINRAPAKVQSALLEAMQEHQVTIGEQTFPLEEPFMVMATQNPLEQEGTYPLPEAQTDRFMMKLIMKYPSETEEMGILDRMASGNIPLPLKKIQPEEILKIRKIIPDIYLDEKLKKYIVNIVMSTRNPDKYNIKGLTNLISWGASPRATIALALGAKAQAFIQGRGYVSPDDIKSIAPDILRHRIILTYEAEAESKTSDDIINTILGSIEVP